MSAYTATYYDKSQRQILTIFEENERLEAQDKAETENKKSLPKKLQKSGISTANIPGSFKNRSRK